MKEKRKKQTKTKTKTKTEKNKGDKSYSEMVRVKYSCCAFKLGFLQLICKSSLIFKSNLELALSIILKERELYKSKYVVVVWRYLKIRDLLSFLICSSILVLKWCQVLPKSGKSASLVSWIWQEEDSLNCLSFLNKRHPNIKITIEKQINHSITFLDVFILGINNQHLRL